MKETIVTIHNGCGKDRCMSTHKFTLGEDVYLTGRWIEVDGIVKVECTFVYDKIYVDYDSMTLFQTLRLILSDWIPESKTERVFDTRYVDERRIYFTDITRHECD